MPLTNTRSCLPRCAGSAFYGVYVDPKFGDDEHDAQVYFILTVLLKENLMEKVKPIGNGERLRLWKSLVTDFEPQVANRRCRGMEFSISGSLQVRIRAKESIVWKHRSDNIKFQPRK